jgi:hypothetical protein
MQPEETPISYQALRPGTPVEASTGERVGAVARVLAVEDKDIFDGIIMQTDAGDRFVDAYQVGTISDRRVVLMLSLAEAQALEPPTGGAPVVRVDPAGNRRLSWWDKLRGKRDSDWDL